jgi:hypothetical protein
MILKYSLLVINNRYYKKPNNIINDYNISDLKKTIY